jgi:hypothetical protein
MTTNDSLPAGDQEAGKSVSGDIGSAHKLPAHTDSIAAQLRRRRAASLRMPPLADARRDPLDIPVSYSSEPLRLFWYELRARGLLTDTITAELLKLANEREVA